MSRTLFACTCLALGLPTAPARAAELPPALAAVPGDAAAFVAVDVPAVLNSPLCDDLQYVLGAVTPAEAAAFAKKFPIDPRTVEHVVVVAPTGATVTDPLPDLHPTAVSALAVFGCSKAFDPAALQKGFSPVGRAKSYRGRVYQFEDENWTGLLVLPGNRAFVIGAEDSLVWLIDRLEKGDVRGPLSPARAEAAGHALFFAVNPAAAVPPKLDLPPALRPLAEAQRVCVAVDLGKSIKGSVELHYADAAGAEAGEKAVKAAVELGRTTLKGLEAQLKEVTDKPPPGGDGTAGPGEFPKQAFALLGIGTLRRLDEVLEKLPVQRAGTAVRFTAELKSSPSGAAAAAAAFAGIAFLGKNAATTFERVGRAINDGPGAGPEEARLKKLAAAFNAYHAEHGHYPPAAATAKDGTPLLSWRVALLPYLGEKELYAEFRQNEPWDSLHNKKLIAKMPAVFPKPTSYKQNYGRTNAMVLTGPGTLFDGPTGAKKPAKAAVLALEASEPVNVWWTKPADRPVAPGKPPELFGQFDFSRCWVLFTDGTVKELTKREDAPRLAEVLGLPKNP
ncbi:Uncharacterized protein OS=Singulisphaera acidiphila (strain ATCC BAA-1392 / DSM 18658 / VKM B-2454 / MOB10) GN=Sinac_0934 PE=4 SV=1: SBP_bac_10 [Gemmataceae bacterium]|nr:Uncharacterized protein OS=Singulisphaera acidiphila (strain ATCC BAA-1392 / DSM 18658 / VKM B-2454 / MOB10) GN=Sinac_0934 PE=4 SV=1: SBP_bac_10 [Gemmataceae bacterium]VTT97500.1 Uncharacterized protein OS=Singulisphaera acidiphila (strain ATCC BAA-1392 / DSM 18658 / VKM B-2454 / MOB10) GN=Sinac_0934 PE=4 SV=1: SBP_bac_10 [Gemmataceae bacterium]